MVVWEGDQLLLCVQLGRVGALCSLKLTLESYLLDMLRNLWGLLWKLCVEFVWHRRCD